MYNIYNLINCELYKIIFTTDERSIKDARFQSLGASLSLAQLEIEAPVVPEDERSERQPRIESTPSYVPKPGLVCTLK